MAITLGTGLLNDLFTDVTVFGVDWIIALITTIMIMLIISRDPEKWKVLLLPVTIVVGILGLTPTIIQYFIGAILFVINTMSTQVMGYIATAVKRPIAYGSELVGYTSKKGIEQGAELGRAIGEYRIKSKWDKEMRFIDRQKGEKVLSPEQNIQLKIMRENMNERLDEIRERAKSNRKRGVEGIRKGTKFMTNLMMERDIKEMTEDLITKRKAYFNQLLSKGIDWLEAKRLTDEKFGR